MGHLLLLSTIILSVNSAGSASTDPLQLSSSGTEQPLEKKTRFGDVGVNMRGVVTHHAGVACHTAIPVPVGRSYLTAAVTKEKALRRPVKKKMRECSDVAKRTRRDAAVQRAKGSTMG